MNDYGQGLRGLIHRTKQLERWLDFKSFQVFDEAITYTALQFFTAEANDVIRVAASPQGEVGDLEWADEALAVPTEAFGADDEWMMLTGKERELIERLSGQFESLGSKKSSTAIFQGLVTSADSIYHLERIGSGKYKCVHDQINGFEVLIEDAIMKPLISGPQAKRFETPVADKYLLFPYFENTHGDFELGRAAFLQKKFPRAWEYLRKFEKELRSRESPKMDLDDGWWGYVYPKNLSFHDLPKLIVAQTVPSLRVSADYDADKYLNNVRVNGILPAKGVDLSYLLGVLNGSVADFVFRRIGKPKQGGWFEANKQFIAPLPIPHADKKQQAEIGKRAKQLQEKWTARRDLLAEAEARLGVLARRKYKPEFLWPDMPDVAALKLNAPKKMLDSEKTEWAKTQRIDMEETRIEALQGFLKSGEALEAQFKKGELRLTADSRPILSQIYLDEAEGQVAETYWRFLILKKPKHANTFAKQLAQIPLTPELPAAKQFVERVETLLKETTLIAKLENEMNQAL